MRASVRSVLLAALLVASVGGAATAPVAAQSGPPAAGTHDDDATNATAADVASADESNGLGHQISVLVWSVVESTPGASPAQETPDAGNETDGDADVTVTDVAVSNETVAVNETVTVSVTVENAGEANGSTDVTLSADGEAVETRNVSVDANATETVTVETTFATAGEHTVAIDDGESIAVTVEEPAPETGEITGTVTDADTGAAIANASVDLSANASDTTGPNGTYALADVAEGNHTLTVTAEGYDEATHEVAVSAGETTTQDVSLAASADESNETAVTFENQTLSNGSVSVASATLADGGFVVIHDESGAVVGASEYLEAGTHESVTIALDEEPETDVRMTAMAHRDTDGNETFDFVTSDGDVDGPYVIDNETVADAATVSVEGEPAPTGSELDVVLDGAPDGLQAYSVTVTLSEDANASIESVESDLLSGDRLQVVDRSNDSITFRAADLGDSVGAFDDSRTLATVSLDGDASLEQADVSVDRLTDDAGAEMNASRVSLALDGPLFEAPLPGSAGEEPPTDPDGDGLYEDVDGDGDADFDDAVTLAFVDAAELSADQQAALDFDDDGNVTFGDAIELAFQV